MEGILRRTIGKQQRRLGISGDWQRSRFTLDPGLVKAVHKVFIELYQEGIIYRGQRLVNWDPVLRTAISETRSNQRRTKWINLAISVTRSAMTKINLSKLRPRGPKRYWRRLQLPYILKMNAINI